jgi:hypothetical protein
MNRGHPVSRRTRRSSGKPADLPTARPASNPPHGFGAGLFFLPRFGRRKRRPANQVTCRRPQLPAESAPVWRPASGGKARNGFPGNPGNHESEQADRPERNSRDSWHRLANIHWANHTKQLVDANGIRGPMGSEAAWAPSKRNPKRVQQALRMSNTNQRQIRCGQADIQRIGVDSVQMLIC